MKIKTFLGQDPLAVDRQINEWLAGTKVAIKFTNTAVSAFTAKGKEQVSGKAITKEIPVIAISVWFEDNIGKSN